MSEKLNILITNSEYEFNQLLGEEFKKNGHSVEFFFNDSNVNYLDYEDNLEVYDLIINGLFDENEEMNFENNFEQYCKNRLLPNLTTVFKINQIIAQKMARKKKGNICFILKYDVLRFLEISTAPIYNNAIISLTKSLSKELSALNVGINSITLGAGFFFDKNHKKDYKLFSLKPRKFENEAIVKVFENLVDINEKALISGQNIELSPGTETSL